MKLNQYQQTYHKYFKEIKKIHKFTNYKYNNGSTKITYKSSIFWKINKRETPSQRLQLLLQHHNMQVLRIYSDNITSLKLNPEHNIPQNIQVNFSIGNTKCMLQKEPDAFTISFNYKSTDIIDYFMHGPNVEDLLLYMNTFMVVNNQNQEVVNTLNKHRDTFEQYYNSNENIPEDILFQMELTIPNPELYFIGYKLQKELELIINNPSSNMYDLLGTIANHSRVLVPVV